MTRSHALSLLAVLVIALVAVPAFAIGWKTGCLGTAFALFAVLKLCVREDRNS